MRGLAAGLVLLVSAPLGVAGVANAASVNRATAGPDLAAATVSRPGAPGADGHLSGVACITAADCMAVGGSFGESGTHSLAEQWNGAGWMHLATPLLNTDQDLSAVVCPRASMCQAVGGVGAERWNGTAWTLEKTPTTVLAPRFSGVACPSASDCVAVGSRGTGTKAVTLAEMWNGSTWTVHNPLNPAGALQASLSWVSCVSRSDCIAVGQYEPSANNIATLAESWNGSAWTMLAMPALGADAALSGVSCVSSTSCVAVGFASPWSLAESWNGSAWTVLPSPPGSPAAISCTGAASCIAVGGTTAESWNGSVWRPLSTPPLATTLTGISCTGSANCMAVGRVADVGSFAMSWNGSRWLALRVNRIDALAGVSCTLAIRCSAVGSYITRSVRFGALTEFWNGLSWRQRTAPAVAGGSRLADVSCVSAADCVAVGSSGPEDALTLAEVWNGVAWRVTPTPSLPPGSQENGVSCAGTHCMAIGRGMLSELWNGATWRVVKVPRPGEFVSGELTDVSCARSTDCMATGFYFPTVQGNSNALAELWNGKSWRLLTPPGIGLNTVSCRSASFCMAVGSDTAEIWNGRKWRTQKLPGSFGFGPGITAVSCVSTSACMAVGNYLAKGGPQGIVGFNVAESWNGTTWQILPTPGPGGGLADVACTSVTRCMAVGEATVNQVGTRTLAERWNGQRWLLLATRNP
jgi:hypothetical protein